MLPFIPLAVSALAPIAQSIIQNRMNKRMSDYTYAKDKQMLAETNAYNSPQQQMARFQAAGLNKNLIYDKGTSGVISSSMPKYNPPTKELRIPDSMSIITQYQDLKNKEKQNDLLSAQIENTKAETANKALMSAILQLRPDLLKSQIGQVNQQTSNLSTSQRLNELALTLKDPARFREAMASNWKGIFPDGTLSQTEYSLQAQQLRNAKTTQEVQQILSRLGINEQTKNWLVLKYNTMKSSNVNIDKDALWQRVLADVFGPTFNDLKGGVKDWLKKPSLGITMPKNIPSDRKPGNSTEEWLWKLGILHQ